MLDQEFNQNPFCLWKPPPEWLPLPGPASLCTDRCRLLIYDVIIKTFSLQLDELRKKFSKNYIVRTYTDFIWSLSFNTSP